jgi:N-acetylmuramoyl-L-alanine amidase
MKKAYLLYIVFLFACPVMAQELPAGFWLGRTTGALPYMEYGLGDDRLGGAKMGYLDTNIVVKVVDSVKEDYKIQLSQFHFAYVPKANVKRDLLLQPRPYVLSESWRVYGDTSYDYVKINLQEKLPYKSMQELSPSRLVVDVYGVTSNTNWITQLNTVKEIKNVYYEQKEDDVLRVIVELKHTQHWGHHISYDSTGNRLVIRIKRQPNISNINKLRIAIDPGHGGDNNGADGVTSHVLEKEYTLLIARQLEKTLKAAGVKNIFMTRTKDTTLSMVERTAMLAQYAPDLLVSIHLNSSGNDTVRGVSTYYRYIGFRPLSKAILNQMLKLGLQEFGNVGNFNFSLNGPTEYPNALVEVAFLSNREDEKRILDPRFHKRVAQQITKGIQDWLAGMKEPPGK